MRRAGFAHRQEFHRFYNRYYFLALLLLIKSSRYKMLSASTWPHHVSCEKNTRLVSKEPVLAILAAHSIGDQEYCIGKTKIFIRNAKTVFDCPHFKLLTQL